MRKKQQRKEQKRRCVSFRPIVFQRIRDAARVLDTSMCGVVESAVMDYCDSKGIPMPLRPHWLDDARARKESRGLQAGAEGRQNFTW